MVTTVASGDTKPYVGTRDVVMFPSVVDVAGVNRISAKIYANAVGAIVGMVETEAPPVAAKPLIAATMFGNTTPAVERAKAIFEGHGYEVLVFHATGTGGRTMEDLVADGFFEGVADITTTEWADELVGGVLTAGPTPPRGRGQGRHPAGHRPGLPRHGELLGSGDGSREVQGTAASTAGTPNVTLMRTTPEENAELGRILAEKANAARGPVAFYLPLKGVSMLDAPGKEFWWPEADAALFEAIKRHVRPDIPVHELDANINDPAFAEAVAAGLLEFLRSRVPAAG
jgi:uncharacterized protein (UPF0261 family)